MENLTPFHLAIPVHDIAKAREFYGDLLGCPQGRSSERWTDYNLFGHQLVCHEVAQRVLPGSERPPSNPVDGHDVPVPHFGVVLEMADWRALADRLKAKGIEFAIEPYIRFEGQVGEQATMFFYDPSGNALEFKAFADIEGDLFRREP